MERNEPVRVATTRSMFLTAGALGSALTALARGEAASMATADRAAIESVLRRTSRHKQVIGAPKIDEGAALRYAGNALNAFEFAFGEGAGTLHILCVLYGTSLLFAANDALWSRYQLFDVLDHAGDPLPLIVHTPQNPFYHAHSSMRTSDAPDNERGFYHDYTVQALTHRGVSWFVCNNALTGLTRQIAALRGADPAGVYDDFRQNLIPGSIIVPSGVAAIILAQEAGFTFLPA
jgi:intracellular sulfur oxidation DsrE/DsrF family protein